MYINRVILCGNLTKAPELKSIPSGQSVATFSIATNKTYTDSNHQKQEKVEFHNIQVWGKQAENCAKFLVKGSQVLIEGELTTRSWEDKTTKEKKYRTEVIAQMVQFGKRPEGSAPVQLSGGQSNTKPTITSEEISNQVNSIDYGSPDINLDDIPF